VRARREEPQDLDDIGVHRGLAHELRVQLVELLARGEITEPEKVTDLLETHIGREVIYLIAAVEETALFTIDLTESCIGDNDALQPFT
jgi:hypothetical protein